VQGVKTVIAKMSLKKLTFCITLALGCALYSSTAFAGKPVHAIAGTGEPLYPKDFTHFSYVNPDAPKGGTLKINVVGTFDSFNPFIVRGNTGYGLSGVMPLIYQRGLAQGWDEPLTMYGLIVKNMEVAEDRSWIIFNIDERAKFSDGKPVTAEDFLFSFETLRNHGRPNHRTYYRKVEKVEILSDRSIKFSFKKNEDNSIDREMPVIMGFMPVLPKHYWQDRDFNQTHTNIPIGSGPYRITSFKIGRQIVCERDTNYWAKDLPSQKGLYNFDKIIVDYYRDDNSALQAFKAGQIDLRAETNPTKWASAYNFPAVQQGKVALEKIETKRTEPAYGYMINTRRPMLSDWNLRKALYYTLDFDWINKNLFHGQFRQVNSIYPNGELAAVGLPEGKELEILEKFRDKVPEEVFTETREDSEGNFRNMLLKAEKILKDAGYILRNNELLTPNGQLVAFEILLRDPAEEKVAINWAAALKRLGIKARVRTVDSAQYQSKISSFDFDVTAQSWFNSLSPGNEQAYYYGSLAAAQPGSRNYPGIKDSAADEIIAMIPKSETREELVSAARALDRVIMSGYYFVPLYYKGFDSIAYWQNKIQHPDKRSLYGNVLESWWAVEE